MNNEVKGIAITIGIVVLGLVALIIFSPKPEDVEKVSNIDEYLYSEDAYMTGDSDAIVKIVKFADYQCPACATIDPFLKELIKDYSSDQVSLIFRHFPLSIHRNAVSAAEAAEAAGVQGKYWEMNDILYSRQSEWNTETRPLDKYKEYASELNLDVDRFTSDIENDLFKEKINSDLSDGLTINVKWTPSIYLDGELLTDLPSFEEFKSRIDDKLNAANSNVENEDSTEETPEQE